MDQPFPFGVLGGVADPWCAWCWLFLAGVLCCGGCIGSISSTREAGIASLGFFGKAVVHSEGICGTGSYLPRLLGISDFVFLI